jgi:hypothetical protein
MDITHYSFAFFVFVLACLFLWFYKRVSRGSKKNDQGSYEREQRLFRLYQNVEDMLNSFEEYAEAAKAEINSSIEKMNAMIKDNDVSAGKAPEASTSKETTENIDADEAEMKPVEMIPLLIKKGMGKSEIAKQLGLTVREVSMIMDIKKITNNADKA